jgi:hypothetical protein
MFWGHSSRQFEAKDTVSAESASVSIIRESSDSQMSLSQISRIANLPLKELKKTD